MDWRRTVRLACAVLLAVAVLVPPTTAPVSAETGDRTLYLYHTHTHETARITFKRNGVYDQKGLQQLDWFLRDWRNNQPTQMSPQLFDLVWEIYQKVGATQPINIVSAYRSPPTNADLHAHSDGVASNSQHMLGHAMDWFVPGVPLTRLRAVAMQQNVGGVGFYPTSGSPFVHTDVGTVRAWPRMTTAQLQAIFPDGKTLHVPTDGHLLSQAGYAYAQQQWNACHAVPCSNPAALQGGAAAFGFSSMVALATTSMTGKTFADIHHGASPSDLAIRNPGSMPIAPDAHPAAVDDNADETDDASVTAGPTETAVATITVKAPIPMERPAGLDEPMQVASVAPLPRPPANIPGGDSGATILAAAANVRFDELFPDAYAPGSAAAAAAMAAASGARGQAPVPAQRSPGSLAAAGTGPRGGRPQSALGAIASIEGPVPADRPAETIVTAYASMGTGTPAEHQLQAIIESETTGAAAPGGTALTNSVGTPLGADALNSYAADRRSNQQMPPTLASIVPVKSFQTRPTQLVAPGYDADLVRPVAVTSSTFAVFVEPAAIDLSPATELGPMVQRLGLQGPTAGGLSVSRFAPAGPLLVAFR